MTSGFAFWTERDETMLKLVNLIFKYMTQILRNAIHWTNTAHIFLDKVQLYRIFIYPGVCWYDH